MKSAENRNPPRNEKSFFDRNTYAVRHRKMPRVSPAALSRVPARPAVVNIAEITPSIRDWDTVKTPRRARLRGCLFLKMARAIRLMRDGTMDPQVKVRGYPARRGRGDGTTALRPVPDGGPGGVVLPGTISLLPKLKCHTPEVENYVVRDVHAVPTEWNRCRTRYAGP